MAKKQNGPFYDGTRLLSMLDINGKRPEIFISTSNRSAGKTTFFGRHVVKRYLTAGEKFCLVYRYNYELDDCSDKFFKDIGGLFFPGMVMESKRMAMGAYHELFLDEKSCGYAVTINAADTLKKYSHLLSDTACMLFDEFQTESGKYCPNEIRKFISVHTSIARGGGKVIRYVPVYMIGNPVSLINPYYIELGISERLKKDTNYLRGDGFVLEQGFVETASRAQKESAFNRAFAANSYVAYAAENVYLNDNLAFIDRPEGKSRYIATIRYMGTDYAVREFADDGLLYVDTRPDSSFPLKVVTTTDDHRINYVMLKRNSFFISVLRSYFEKGCFRFKDMRCKEALIQTLRV